MADHCHQRHDAGSPGDQQQGTTQLCLPYEVAADRAAHLDLVSRDQDVVQVRRDLTFLQAFNGQVDLSAALRLRSDRIAPLGLVSIRRGQADIVMLAGAVLDPIFQGKRKSFNIGSLFFDRFQGGDLPPENMIHIWPPPYD